MNMEDDSLSSDSGRHLHQTGLMTTQRARQPPVTVLQFNPPSRDDQVTSVIVHPLARQNITVDITIFRRRMLIGEITHMIAAAVATDSTDLRLSVPHEPQADLLPWLEVPRVLMAASIEVPTFTACLIPFDGFKAVSSGQDLWAYVWPERPPTCQPRTHSESLRVEGEEFGGIFAPATAPVRDVLVFAESVVKPRDLNPTPDFSLLRP